MCVYIHIHTHTHIYIHGKKKKNSRCIILSLSSRDILVSRRKSRFAVSRVTWKDSKRSARPISTISVSTVAARAEKFFSPECSENEEVYLSYKRVVLYRPSRYARSTIPRKDCNWKSLFIYPVSFGEFYYYSILSTRFVTREICCSLLDVVEKLRKI